VDCKVPKDGVLQNQTWVTFLVYKRRQGRGGPHLCPLQTEVGEREKSLGFHVPNGAFLFNDSEQDQ